MYKGIFRGKRLDNGEWVEGYYVCLGRKYHYILSGQLSITSGFPDFIKYEVDPATVSQFTGLTDRNGKKIFEGDILRGAMGDMVVFYDEIIGEGYGFQWKAVNGGACESMTGFIDEYEVIGNIHDNPELLEVPNE